MYDHRIEDVTALDKFFISILEPYISQDFSWVSILLVILLKVPPHHMMEVDVGCLCVD